MGCKCPVRRWKAGRKELMKEANWGKSTRKQRIREVWNGPQVIKDHEEIRV